MTLLQLLIFMLLIHYILQTGIKGINNVLTGRAKKAGGYLWE